MTEFEQDCTHFHGEILSGKFQHYCHEFDMLPIDDTCFEFMYCNCFEGEEFKQAREKIRKEYEQRNSMGS